MDGPTAIRVPQMRGELEELEHALCALDKTIACLQDRLTPVLSLPCAPPPTKEIKGAAERELVPMAAEIRGYRQRVSRAVGTLDDLIGRIES